MSLEGTRALLASHKTGSAMRALSALIEVVAQQEKQIAELNQMLLNDREHADQRITRLQQQIDRLKGVHGA
jgi:uncharacterized coiled-coil protein SlyX